MSVKQKSTRELLAEADEKRLEIYNKAVPLRRVAIYPDEVKRIAEEIKEMCSE